MCIGKDSKENFDTQSNRVPLKKSLDSYVQDDFAHEQSLIVTEKGKSVLFSGCSHKGVANILRTAYKYQPVIKAVFGGFHLYSPSTNVTEPAEAIQRLAQELSQHDAVFYTCHCTGNIAFEIMRGSLGDKIQYFSTGSAIEL